MAISTSARICELKVHRNQDMSNLVSFDETGGVRSNRIGSDKV